MTALNPKVKKQDGEGNGARWAERKPPRDPWRKSRRGNQHGCFSLSSYPYELKNVWGARHS